MNSYFESYQTPSMIFTWWNEIVLKVKLQRELVFIIAMFSLALKRHCVRRACHTGTYTLNLWLYDFSRAFQWFYGGRESSNFIRAYMEFSKNLTLMWFKMKNTLENKTRTRCLFVKKDTIFTVVVATEVCCCF